MKEYLVETITTERPHWGELSELLVDEYPWGCPFEDGGPLVSCELALSDSGLHVLMACSEPAPRATYTENNQPVCEDSCLEFFISGELGGDYINFECNANGALWSAFGPDREHRRFLRDLGLAEPEVTVHKSAQGWGIEYIVPGEVFVALFGHAPQPGECFYANFYKCGDQTDVPHYAVWNPVTAPEPDYHRPECFGRLRIGSYRFSTPR